jgi:RNA polymerase sigma-70 factor (ECF subfamily)
MESDLSLLNAAKRMDRDALVRIFDLYAASLYKYALRLCGDPLLADHIVGDVFAKLLDQLASGKGPSSNLRSYLYEMAYHSLVDEARYSRRRVPLDALTSLPPNGHSRLPEGEDPIQLEMIQEAIQHDLTEDQRHVIVLRFLEEFSLRETAAILGKEVNHVKVIQSRALAKLRQALESKDILVALSLPRMKELTRTPSL